MFCPNCGRDNSSGRKFCGACGTNLEAVSQALSGARDDFFTKTDAALDQLIARYSEHIFTEAPAAASDRRLGNSWKLLGQGVVTSLVDVILVSLMWNILPLRFLILLIASPFRLLTRRNRKGLVGEIDLEGSRPGLPSAHFTDGLPEPESVSEHTTERLEEYRRRLSE